jgi:hypothetical protein
VLRKQRGDRERRREVLEIEVLTALRRHDGAVDHLLAAPAVNVPQSADLDLLAWRHNRGIGDPALPGRCRRRYPEPHGGLVAGSPRSTTFAACATTCGALARRNDNHITPRTLLVEASQTITWSSSLARAVASRRERLRCRGVCTWLCALLRPAALLPATASLRSRMSFMITFGLASTR